MGKTRERVFADFEFNGTKNPLLNLVSCCTFDEERNELYDWWLLDDKEEQENLAKYLSQYRLIEGYSCVAEARSLISLGLDPLDFAWADYYFEYRCLSNHYDLFSYGKQLVNGKVSFYAKPRPKWEQGPEDEVDENGEKKVGFKPTYSLAEATYKLTEEIRDTKEKDEVRDLIISAPKEFTKEQKKRILKYGREDVRHLPKIKQAIYQEYMDRDPQDLERLQAAIETRGRFAAITAWQEAKGYPIDVEKTRNFSKQVGSIIMDCQRDINGLFPDIKPFRWEKTNQRFAWDQKKTRDWVAANHAEDNWDLTDGGSLSLSLEAWEKYYPFKHDYPRDNFGAQIVRFLKLKQSLYGFVPSVTGGKKTFWDSVGPDGRVRPYLNPYGAQSSRSQPAATGFMYLKPAWMRALVQPKPGMAMAGIDYGSQEFFVAALLSQDDAMIQAYLSGDPYLEFAKLAGMVPKDGKRKDYEFEREACKASVLGISYMMTKYGLARKLTTDTGRLWSEEEAQGMIDKFYSAFPNLKIRQNYTENEYKNQGFLRLVDGWYMWGDNPNMRSVGNCPIQGFGACVMRKSLDLAFSNGLYIPFPLHDADYIEYKVGQEKQILQLREHMREAFVHYFDDPEIRKLAANIRLDAKAWSHDYKDLKELDIEGWKVPCSEYHIDKRAQTDYDMFSKYFDPPDTDLI